mgnify:CR=1 FL=1
MPTILLRRGTTVERDEYTPLQGEIIFDTTDNRVYTGDGTTAGGVPVGSAYPKTKTQREAMTPLLGQLIFDTTDKVLYVGDGTTSGGIRDDDNFYPAPLTRAQSSGTDTNVLEFKVNSDTISSTATHTITNSYTEITTSNETSDLGTNDAPAITLTGNNGSIVYVYFKTAGTRTAESSPFGTTTRNITVQGVSMVQGNFKTFFKTTDGWKEI